MLCVREIIPWRRQLCKSLRLITGEGWRVGGWRMSGKVKRICREKEREVERERERERSREVERERDREREK